MRERGGGHKRRVTVLGVGGHEASAATIGRRDGAEFSFQVDRIGSRGLARGRYSV